MPVVKWIQMHPMYPCMCRMESKCNNSYISWREQLSSLLDNMVTLLSAWPLSSSGTLCINGRERITKIKD